MKQVVLNIPDNKYRFFMELVKNLGFVKDNNESICDEHKVIVRNRIINSNKNPEVLQDWEKVKENFKFDE